MSALEALAAAKAAGVRLSLDGDGLILETQSPELPPDVVEVLKAAKPDLLHVLEWREAAKATLAAAAPDDCSEDRWTNAMRGLHRFVVEGWADRAALMGWTKDELYRVPRFWSRVDLTGAALLIGQSRVIAVTEASIVIETQSGLQLKFRRIGREQCCWMSICPNCPPSAGGRGG
jgi:hypothetical protein